MELKSLAKALGAGIATLVVISGLFYGWAALRARAELDRTIDTHAATFPIPFPLTETELVELGLEEDPGSAIALERAIERGEHLVTARYGCGDCHGADFSGGVMIDAFPIGTILGPNLTTGDGSATIDYETSDWDRIVRHGVKPDGRPALMPASDYQLMSDQELSDIVVYIRSRPPKQAQVVPPELGPMGKVLLATGQIPLAADLLPSHGVPHNTFPPEATVSVEFGRHLAGPCIGCHGERLAGGPIPGGDPSWAPAANLTPHEEGLAAWTFDAFRAAMTEGIRPDGTPLRAPMDLIVPYGNEMTDVELEALWSYLRSVPPLPMPR